MPAAEAREAVLNALSLIGVDPVDSSTALPTARTRAVVDRLCDATPDKLREERVDMRQLMRDLLDWRGPRATKAVNRTALAAMLATRDDGASLWPHAVEALSYTAIWAPLLDPDRLGRVLEHASAHTTTAFAPIRYTTAPAAKLYQLVGHYQPARLEMLATTLWDAAHDGRWWDVSCGLGVGADGGLRRRRRRRLRGEDLEAYMEARTAAITATGNDDATEAVANLVGAQDHHWTPANAALLGTARLDGAALDEVIAFSGEEHHDPDAELLLSNLVDLPPMARPTNPVPAMIDALEFLLDGADPADTLPKKPTHFGQLYPNGSLAEYPIHSVVLSWDFAEVPNCPGAVVEVIRSPHELFENRDYMGNCTGGFNERIQRGEYVLGKIHYENALYNWSIRRGDGQPWALGEINSRFNRGGVPEVLRAGVNSMIAEINAGRRGQRVA